MSISEKECFDKLEISPTSDIRIIKKAYSKVIRKYHPEDDAEKYQEIRQAYEVLVLKNKESLLSYEIDKNASKEFEQKNFYRSENEQNDFEKVDKKGETINVFSNSFEKTVISDSELEKEIDELIKRSDDIDALKPEVIAADYVRFKEVYHLVEKISSDVIGAEKGHDQAINSFKLDNLRKHELYKEALRSKYFVKKYASILSKSDIDAELADLILQDIEEVKDENLQAYSDLLYAIKERRIEKPKEKKKIPERIKVWISRIILATICFVALMSISAVLVKGYVSSSTYMYVQIGILVFSLGFGFTMTKIFIFPYYKRLL